VGSSSGTKRRVAATLVASTAMLGLATFVAEPAVAQAPGLGFEVDVTEGRPGDTVNGQVDVDDVAANCTTDREELRAKFNDFANAAQTLILEEGYLPASGDGEYHTYEELSAATLLAASVGPLYFEEYLDEALSQTFVVTFAEVATQEPVGERVNFDPGVGQATITVPDLDPGVWAVAAACVEPSTDPARIRTAISEGASYLESQGIPLPYVTEGPDAFIPFAAEHGPTVLVPVMQPQALGAQIFTILGEGQPPTSVPPGSPGTPGPGAQDPGGPGTPPSAAPAPLRPAQPAIPVAADPTYTG
jgi:hypothetical protein